MPRLGTAQAKGKGVEGKTEEIEVRRVRSCFEESNSERVAPWAEALRAVVRGIASMVEGIRGLALGVVSGGSCVLRRT